MWSNLRFFGAGRRSRCATTKPIRFATNFDEEGPLRRRATRGVAPPPSTILPRLTLTEHRDVESLTFVRMCGCHPTHASTFTTTELGRHHGQQHYLGYTITRAAFARKPCVAARAERRLGGRGHTCLSALSAEYAPLSCSACRRNTMVKDLYDVQDLYDVLGLEYIAPS